METEKPTEKKEKKISEKEFEKRVLELAKEGLTSEKIGEALRKEKIHPKEFKKKISKILKENDLYENPDVKNISKKLEAIKVHYEKNKQDKRAKREKDRIFSQLRKIKKHFGLLEEKKK
jgi:ribosomal protein S15P/S13E